MLQSIYPVLLTEKLNESNEFYKTHFGFAEIFKNDWYISLSHPNNGELALIDVYHNTIPDFYQSVVRGMFLNIEVDDAAQLYDYIADRSSHIIVTPLQEEDYGYLHFMVQDPNGILVDIIQKITPTSEYQDNYITEECKP